jgi:hypothetical protein
MQQMTSSAYGIRTRSSLVILSRLSEGCGDASASDTDGWLYTHSVRAWFQVDGAGNHESKRRTIARC